MESHISRLSDETIRKLQTLIRANLDSYEGLRLAGDHLTEQADWNQMYELAFQRGLHAQRLQRIVAGQGEEPFEDGSVLGMAHRVWTDLRSAISGGSDEAVLAEAERGEGYIKSLYEEILKDIAGSSATAILNEQYQNVLEGYETIKAMRENRS